MADTQNDQQGADTQNDQQTIEATTSILNDDGTWNREAFGELGEHSVFQKYSTPEEMIKGAINAQQLLGKRAEDWWNSDDPEIIKERSRVMGVPEDPSEYNFKVPEGLEANEDALNETKTFFKEIGVPKDLAEKLVEFDADRIVKARQSAQEAAEAELKESVKELQGNWKDKYDYNVSKVADSMDHLGLSEFKDDPAIGNNPKFIRAWFEKVLPLMDNDEIVAARQAQSLASAEDTLISIEDEMMNYPEEKLNDAHYNSLIRRRTEILQKLS